MSSPAPPIVPSARRVTFDDELKRILKWSGCVLALVMSGLFLIGALRSAAAENYAVACFRLCSAVLGTTGAVALRSGVAWGRWCLAAFFFVIALASQLLSVCVRGRFPELLALPEVSSEVEFVAYMTLGVGAYSSCAHGLITFGLSVLLVSLVVSTGTGRLERDESAA